MLKKTKKLLFLSTGLAGALAASSVAGVALSSCTVETVSGGSSSSSGITLPDTWYNKDINWTDATSLNSLIIDDNGLVYSNKYMTEIIAILPGYGGGTITIPASVKTISGYNNVTTDASGDTVKTVTGAFEGLTSLTKVVFAGKNVTQIGAQAFKDCTGLQSITLPSSVTLVDTYAFYGCTTLNTINLDNVQYIGISAFEGAMVDAPASSISLNLNKTVLIGSSAFKGVTGIGSVDFSKNTTLTQIGASAFSGCTGLSGDIDLSNASKLITIGDATNPSTSGSSFLNAAITNVYLPSTAGLRTIAASTFSGCTNLVTVAPKGITGFKATESVSGIYSEAFAGTKIASADISLATSSTPLQAGAFSGMTALTSVSLGTTITTIPSACFMNCSALTSLTLPTSITSISGGTPAFSGTTTASSGSITFASDYPAFYGSGLTSLDLSTITSYSTTSGSTLSLPDTLLYNCASLESVTLKAGTTSIGQGSFAGTTALTSITTGTSTKASEGYTAESDITSIGQFAFWQSGLSSVDLSAIGSSFTTLQNYTFAACPNLKSIILPTTTTVIATSAVISTPELASVNFEDLALTKINNNNFSNCKLTDINLTKATINDFDNDNVFKALTESTTVKLSSSLWNISASGTAFTYSTTADDGTTTLVPLNVTFPNGFAPTTTSNFTSGNLTAHTMFGRIADSLDMSSFTALRSISVRTFFGGPVESLAFNASQFASGKFGSYYSSSSASWGHLGFIGTGITSANTETSENPSTYVTTYLPFGSMTKLNAITFDKFTSADTTSTSVMAKTTAETWSEVARIVSSFAKSATSGDDIAANLSEWTDENITASINYGTGDDSDVVTSVDLKDSNSTTLLSISDSTSSGNFSYSGITWTISVDSSTGTITLTSSEDVNTYKLAVAATSGYTTYKAFFNTTTSTTGSGESAVTTVLPDSTITVKLNIVAASTN